MSSIELTKDNFDLDNMSMKSESTIEHDDSDYDHWELTMFLPDSMNREDVEKFVEHIINSKEKAKKWDNLMTHSKWHNTFGCSYHFEVKEEKRRNQFLQSENQKLKEGIRKISKAYMTQELREFLDDITPRREARV